MKNGRVLFGGEEKWVGWEGDRTSEVGVPEDMMMAGNRRSSRSGQAHHDVDNISIGCRQMATIAAADSLPRCSTKTACVLHPVAVVLKFTGAHLGAKFTTGRHDGKTSCGSDGVDGEGGRQRW